MTIVARDKVVSFHYRLYEGEDLLEDSGESQSMTYLHGYRGIFSGLEEVLEGRSVGESVSTTLTPDQTYGYRQQHSIHRIAMKHVMTPKRNLQPGKVVIIETDQGPKEVILVKAGKFNVDVDINHPLAGKTLRFEMDIHKVRDANKEELVHGHAHGEDGYDH